MHNGHDNYNAEESIKAGYEVTDLNAKLIVIFLAALAFLIAGSVFVIIIFQRGFDKSRLPMNLNEASPVAVTPPPVVVPGFAPLAPGTEEGTALLQQDPVAERKKYFAESHAHLAGQGFVSQEAGAERVHIPIETAMALVAEAKVPYRQVPVTALAEEAKP
ncbi:MAG: hypothetical protein HYV27_13585 [Candidatus Hydrogenedentes bacterium]|nr:hypothetical protein [Candidatus Hydrogenedentota bacterium]